jgi:malonyl CoA-acyl carrier protein transacylase
MSQTEQPRAKATALVICPGRGTYTKTELGYLRRQQGRKTAVDRLVGILDDKLAALGEPTVSALDGAEQFSLKTHTPGEYASALIYACSAADFLSIDRDKYDIVAVTGNSMGWYTALSLAGALDLDGSFSLIHTMGSMMRGGIVGGQLIYPVVDKLWRSDSEKAQRVRDAVRAVNAEGDAEVHLSIRFGGYAILGGNEAGLQRLMRLLPPEDDGKYPFILVNHAAFHTPLLRDVSERAFAELPPDLFQAPALPLIDGRGAIWQPYATEVADLYRYTLGHQVVEPYDFTTAVTVALKEFAPDKLILLGPGATSGGAIAQILIENRWLGLETKDDFAALQAKEPFLLAMGREDQRGAVV